MHMKRHSLTWRFAVFYFLLGILPIVALIGLFSFTSTKITMEDSKQLFAAELSQTVYYTEKHMNDLENKIIRYTVNPRFVSFLSMNRKYESDMDSINVYLQYFRPLLMTDFLSGGGKQRLKIYYLNPQLMQGYDIFIYADEAVRAKEEYKRVVEGPLDSTNWYFDVENGVIHAGRAIYHVNTDVICGVFDLSESVQELEAVFQHISTDLATVFLVDESGRIIASNEEHLNGAILERALWQTPGQEAKTRGIRILPHAANGEQKTEEPFVPLYPRQKDYTVLSGSLSGSNPSWQLVMCVPRENLMAGHRAQTMPMIYLSIIIGMVSAGLLMGLLTRQIKRITRLAGIMNSEGEELPAANIPLSRHHDEFDEIVLAYNGLIARIKRLIEENYQAQLKQKETELHALQSQMNPHFLYNLLEQIRMRLMLSGNDDVARMILLLSRLLRRSAAWKNDVIPLREEIMFLQYYLELQTMRYNGRIAYHINVPEDMQALPLPRFTLQPLIENAFVHGFASMSDQGNIWLKAEREGDDVYLTVSDDATQASAEAARTLQDDLDTGAKPPNSVGIMNVHLRMKMYFGERYGIVSVSPFDIQNGTGWVVRLRMPAKARDENQIAQGGNGDVPGCDA